MADSDHLYTGHCADCGDTFKGGTVAAYKWAREHLKAGCLEKGILFRKSGLAWIEEDRYTTPKEPTE